MACRDLRLCERKGSSVIEDIDIKARFDARSVNVTKLTSIADCDIMMGECDFAVAVIDRQLADQTFGDDQWEISARLARSELLHKKSMVEIKRRSLEARSNAAPVSPEDRFKSRFMKVAQEMLPADIYKVLFESAREKAAA